MEEKKAKTQRFNYLIIASVVLFGLFMWVLVSINMTPPTPQELFELNFEMYEAPAALRGTAPEDKLDIAFAPYREGNYEQAFLNLQLVDLEHPNDENVLFYSGMCLLKMNRPEDAMTFFEQVLALPDNQSTIQTKWYIGLTWLKLENIEKAAPIFRALTEYPNRYKDASQEILDALSQN